ncbi:hypothetical protein RRG08_020319 [Elysia crispata]|uniref:Uncharacterized protein n=1 Tax=Elysia crispata TaxID=231223 RepID=A0AAE0YBQ2_9GAST|nr:hypothetical protein RRG08_020319 [Elysia crispata]
MLTPVTSLAVLLMVTMLEGSAEAKVSNVTASRVKVNGDSSELLAVTTDAPEIAISVGNIGANGTLKSNTATIYIDLAVTRIASSAR